MILNVLAMIFKIVLQEVLLRLDQVLKNQELLLARSQTVVDPAECILDIIPTPMQTMEELDEFCIRLDDANFRKTMVSLCTFCSYYYSILHIIEDISGHFSRLLLKSVSLLIL